MHDRLRQAQLQPDPAHLVLEQRAQRLDQLELEVIGQPADVVVGLDVGRTGTAAGLHHVRVERALHEKVDLLAGRARLGLQVAGRLLEDPDELPADDLALLLGVGDAAERAEEPVHRVDSDQPDSGGRDEIPLHLGALAGAQQAVVDEHAGQLVADGAVHQGSRHRGVHPAGQPADRPPVTDLLADRGHRLVHDGRGGPLRTDTGDLVQEPAQHLLTVRRVHHLGVVLHTGQPAVEVFEGSDRSVVGRGGDGEALGCLAHRVAVAHPHRVVAGQLRVQRAAVTADGQLGAAVLAGTGVLHRAAERGGHRLEAVADTEDRDARVEQLRIDLRRAVGVDAGGTAGEHDGGRVAARDVLDRGVVRDDLGVDLRLPHPSRDQLGVLGAVIDNENRPLALAIGAPVACGTGHVVETSWRERWQPLSQVTEATAAPTLHGPETRHEPPPDGGPLPQAPARTPLAGQCRGVSGTWRLRRGTDDHRAGRS